MKNSVGKCALLINLALISSIAASDVRAAPVKTPPSDAPGAATPGPKAGNPPGAVPANPAEKVSPESGEPGEKAHDKKSESNTSDAKKSANDTDKAPDAEKAGDDPTAKVRSLVEETQNAIDAVLQLEPKLDAATGEQRALLFEQQNVKRRAAGEKFHALVAEVQRLRSANVDDADAGKAAVRFVARIETWAQTRLSQERKLIERLRTERDSATPEEQVEIDRQLAAANIEYDRLLRGMLDVCQSREALGLDSEKQYRQLDELLQQRAETRAGQIRVTRKRIAELASQAGTTDETESKRLQEEIARNQARLDRRTKSLQQIITLMDARKLPTAEYRQLLIATTGEITTAIFDREVATGLIQEAWSTAEEWIIASGPSLLFKLILIVAIVLAFHILGRLAQRLMRRALQASKVTLSTLLKDFFLTSTYRAVIGLGLLIAMSQLGVEIGPLLAGLGVAGFIVGFALQDTLSNFASGMMILIYRPFDVGDVVNAGGVSGKVDQMTLVTTTILTFDNQRLIVPNTKIWGDVITNVTAERVRRVDLKFGISYADDITKAEQILADIVENHEKVLPDPAPNIRLHELGDSSVNFIVRPWARTVDYWDVYWDVTWEVKRRFDAEGVTIPFPQRDVHMHRTDSGDSDR